MLRRQATRSFRLGAIAAVAILSGFNGFASAQPVAQPVQSVSFDEAVSRAVSANPTMALAAATVSRAEALLTRVRAVVRPTADVSVVATTIEPVPSFEGTAISPRTQVNAGLGLNVPLFTPARWADAAHAADQVTVATRAGDDVRRRVAVATAEAYLAVIAQRRVVELNERARETARAHYEYATQRFEGGMGSRLNQLRAQQELSTTEVRVEDARLAVRRAQEALGVLIAADGPVDAGSEPAFEIPAEAAGSEPPAERADLRLVTTREAAADRAYRDAWREYLPSISARVSPQLLLPTGLFAEPRTLTAQVLFSVPIFDAGDRRGLTRERQALLETVRAERNALEREARAEVRTAREAVRSTEQAVASARNAAGQATEVVSITDTAFRTGATTNIEVIDAQRRARDAETEAVIAEDALRRARLELLVALGRFPQ